MPKGVKSDVPPYPTGIGSFGLPAIVSGPERVDELDKELGGHPPNIPGNQAAR